MKNKIYIIGLLSSMFIITGAMFKIMHWPGAGISLILGIALLCSVFLPAATISSYKDNGRKKAILQGHCLKSCIGREPVFYCL